MHTQFPPDISFADSVSPELGGLILACVDNGDLVLFYRTKFVVASELASGDSVDLIYQAAKNLSTIMETPLCEVPVPVPDKEDWTWDDIRASVFEGEYSLSEIPLDGIGPHPAFPGLTEIFQAFTPCYQIALTIEFNARVRQLKAAGASVEPDSDQPGMFWYETPDGERSDISYDTRVAAWNALLLRMI